MISRMALNALVFLRISIYQLFVIKLKQRSVPKSNWDDTYPNRGRYHGRFLFPVFNSCYFQVMNFETEIGKVLAARKADTDMVNVIEVLGYSRENFQHAVDIALAMDNKNLVKLVYSNFDQQKIVIEFTLLGKRARPDK